MIRIFRSPKMLPSSDSRTSPGRPPRFNPAGTQKAPANRGLHAAPSRKCSSPEVGGEAPVEPRLDLVDFLLVLHPERRGDRGAARRDCAVDGDRLGAEV